MGPLGFQVNRPVDRKKSHRPEKIERKPELRAAKPGSERQVHWIKREHVTWAREPEIHADEQSKAQGRVEEVDPGALFSR